MALATGLIAAMLAAPPTSADPDPPGPESPEAEEPETEAPEAEEPEPESDKPDAMSSEATATGPTTPPTLELRLASAIRDVRLQALREAEDTCRLGRPAPCKYFEELALMLVSDPAIEVQVAAAAALGRLGEVRARDGLAFLAAHHMDEQLRQACAEALASLPAEAATAPPAPTARTTPGEVRTPTPADEAATAPEEDPPLTDLAPTRVVYGPTGFIRPAGTFSATCFDIGYWSFDYAITDNVAVGLHTLVPVGVVMFSPTLKLAYSFHEYVHLGIEAQFGVLHVWWNEDNQSTGLLFGGGPVASFGTVDYHLNLSVMTHGTRWKDGDIQTLVLPEIGGSVRVSRRVKLNAELYFPYHSSAEELFGELAVLLYGVRIFGEEMFGDVAFMIPFHEEVYGFLKYFPLGAPMLTLGFAY